MSVRTYLEELPLFFDLTGPEIDLLVPHCRLVEGQAGHRLIREGEPVRTIYFLVTGEAAVLKDNMVIASVGKGTVLGEMSLIHHSPAFATIEAKGPFTALAIEQAVFIQLLEEHARLGFKIFKKIARILTLRLMMTDSRLADQIAIPHDYRHD
jgi:CRP-like cAMP-binding protein